MRKLDEFRFRILDNSPEGVILLDTDYRIVYLNHMIEQWSGLRFESVEGKTIMEIFPHMDKPAYRNRMKQVMEIGFPLILSSQLHPNLIPFDEHLKERIGQTTLSRVERTDTSDYLLRVSLMDVTATTQQYRKIQELQKRSASEIAQRKEAQAALEKERGELAEANASKDKFFSILAHDLRGPLGGVVSMSETMLAEYDLFDADEIKDIIKVMHESSDRIFELLKNLLTWSRLNTGRIDFEPMDLELQPIVRKIHELFKSQLEKKELDVSIDCGEGIAVHADAAMLETVLRNLLSNAFKFTPRGGEIRFSSGEVEDERVYFEIRDTGVGMSEEAMEKVFDVSSKYHTPGTENEASSGLGLVLVKEFVERNGGELSVSSEIDQGTIFRVEMPAAKR